jgi:hypothetical protein
VFSAPQLSLYELKTISELLEGKKISESKPLIVTTSKGYRSAGEDLGYLRNSSAPATRSGSTRIGNVSNS